MLLTLPQEVQEAIIRECALVRPSSIAALAKTCQSLRLLIGIPLDHHLWRSIFLSVFDDPRPALCIQSGRTQDQCGVSFNWQREAEKRFRAAIRMDRAAMAEMAEFREIVDEDAVDALLNTALLALPVDLKSSTSEPSSVNEQWLEDCLRAAILPKVKTPHIAKLHLLASFAHVRTSVSLPAASSITSSCRLRSRAYTYDMRHYTSANEWGPWLPDSDGDVNWEHLWHLVNVVRHNAYQRGNSDIPLSGVDSLRAYSVPKCLDDPLPEMNDWAGVQGVWYRAVSFMDYRDLHEYNYSSRLNEDGSLSTRVFENLQFDEAFRIIKGCFTVTNVDAEGPPEYPHFPPIHFVGDASLPNYPQDTMVHRITQGTVSMTKHGHVKWSFVTRVGGHIWASEGVQIGGIQSRAGVVGVWSSADHEEGDPAGPFWLWRSGEGKDSLKPRNPTHIHYHLLVNLMNQQQ